MDGYLAPGTLTLSEKLCNITVKTLEASTSGELSELCLELLHTQAENGNLTLLVMTVQYVTANFVRTLILRDIDHV